jgi:dCMP deaminase
MNVKETYKWLDLAHRYAMENSTCAKVQVGSVIVNKIEGLVEVAKYGCNHGCMNCRKNGCLRVKIYGENSKAHRLPSDCDALHSEVDAIGAAAKAGIPTQGATIYVTRYPCEACARAIVAAGIKTVVYGRNEYISDYTAHIFECGGVNWVKSSWTEEDDNG